MLFTKPDQLHRRYVAWEAEEDRINMADAASRGANSMNVKFTMAIRNSMRTGIRNLRIMKLIKLICYGGWNGRVPVVALARVNSRL